VKWKDPFMEKFRHFSPDDIPKARTRSGHSFRGASSPPSSKRGSPVRDLRSPDRGRGGRGNRGGRGGRKAKKVDRRADGAAEEEEEESARMYENYSKSSQNLGNYVSIDESYLRAGRRAHWLTFQRRWTAI